MQESPVFLKMPTGESIAVLSELPAGANSGVFWLGGFKSVMTGTKATALCKWVEKKGISSCRFDYSGNGASDEGNFEDATISKWLDQAERVFQDHAHGPQIILGSSLGAWIALLLYRKLTRAGQSDRVAGIVLLAPAADMTHELTWKNASAEIRKEIETKGVWYRPSRYGDGDYPITKKLIDDGANHLLLSDGLDVHCPVRILHGDADPDVPWQHGLKLYNALRGDDISFTLIKNGDHRLSSETEIARLISTVGALL